MPKYWVKDYFKHLLVESADTWYHATGRGTGTKRSDVVETVTEHIATALKDRNEAVPDGLANVCINNNSIELFHRQCGSLSESGSRTKHKR